MDKNKSNNPSNVAHNKIIKKKPIRKRIINQKYIKPIKFIIFLLLSLIIFFIEYYIIPNPYYINSVNIIDIQDLQKNKSFINNFIQDNITIVTAYYKINSKHSLQKYIKWIKNLLQINKSMIFFIDKSFYENIIFIRPKKYQKKTLWIKTDIKDFYSYKNFYKEFNQTYELDIEQKMHSVPLYLIWAEKCNFLKTAVLKNYFNSKCFYWVDAGCFRERKKMKKYKNILNSSKKCEEDGRVTFNEIKQISKSKIEQLQKFNYETHLELQNDFNVDGSFFGGQRNYIIEFSDLYYDTIKLFERNKIFIGKDQNLYAYIAYLNPDIVKLIYSGEWFYMQEYLSSGHS